MTELNIVDVSKQIEKKIQLLEHGRKQLEKKARAKAKTSAEYEKKLAIVIIRLRNGVEIGIDKDVIKVPPATLIEKIAKGVCWEEKLAMETAEAEYKLTVEKSRIREPGFSE